MRRTLVIAFFVALGASCTDEEATTPCATEFEQECTCPSGATGAYDCSANCVCDVFEDMSIRDANDASDMEVVSDLGMDASVTDMSSADADGQPDMQADASTAIDASDSDMSAAVRPGDCQTDVDCPNGTCRPIADDPLSWRVCVSSVSDPTICDESQLTFDECCDSNDCDAQLAGQCTRGPIFYCGGAAPMPANVCVYSACNADADCVGQGVGVCVDAGAWGEPNDRCVYGDCRIDPDCDSRAGGECRPFFEPCANRFVGLFCTYDDSTCRVDADCPSEGGPGAPYCAPGDDGVTTCESFLPPP